jgi:predicted nuclease of restriction endonuclease-like RecB superfamily
MGAFDRAAIIAAVAEAHETIPEIIEGALFADLKQAQTLQSFEPIDAEALLDVYALSQEQAVLLRATRVQLKLTGGDVGAYRHFFRTLKFRQLLHRITPFGDGYLVEIDGPHSLFRASTRYGQRLALLLPAIRAFPEWALRAELLWGKDKRRLWFAIEGTGGGSDAPSRLPDDVAELVARFKALKSDWRVRRATKILNLPGAGLCVPDLVFTHSDGTAIYLEVMGFWSRAAVWQRVELVQRGLPDRIVFAVSTKLRVSEAVLDEDLPGQLYVYKQKMHAPTLLRRFDALR